MSARSLNRRLRVRLMLAIAAVALMTAAPGAALPVGNAVQQWNRIAEDTIVGSGAFQNEGLIYMAYVSAAVYDAVVAIAGGYEPYAVYIDARPGASIDAAVAEAAYVVLRHHFPAQAAALDTLHEEALAQIADGPAEQDGRAVGLAAGEAILALRANDGRLTPVGVTAAFPLRPPGPGVWRLTPPAFAAPQTPWVGSVEPFVLRQPVSFTRGLLRRSTVNDGSISSTKYKCWGLSRARPGWRTRPLSQDSGRRT
jgi:hypothetical protein